MSFFNTSRAFLKGILLNPRSIGAVLPSSTTLANHMAACIDRAQQGMVLELGPGTGVVTRAILKAGVPPENLIALELAPHFAARLRDNFPGIQITEGNAKDMATLMAGKNITTIISSLPLRSIPKEDREKILFAISEILRPRGRFIQFTYALHDNHAYDPKSMGLIKSFIVWQNLPPARVSVMEKV